MIDEAAIVRQHLEEAALRLLHRRRGRRYRLSRFKATLRAVLNDKGLYSVKVREDHDLLLAAYLDGHERFKRVADNEPEWEARRLPAPFVDVVKTKQ